jgi:hypothetical protein
MNTPVKSRIASPSRLLSPGSFRYSGIPLSVFKIVPISIACYFLACFWCIQSANAIELQSDSEIATAGYYQLSWSGKTKTFELQESSEPTFVSYRTVYQGSDLATIISGKPDGDYFYRIQSIGDDPRQQSEIIKVTVAHHPLSTAFMFFIAGAIVFLATLFLILKGKRQN